MAHKHPSFQEPPYQGPVVEAGDWKLAFRNQLPKVPSDRETFIFAHGKSFNWDAWVASKTLDHLTAAGHRTLAVDMPPRGNFGDTRTTGEPLGDPTVFWKTILERFRIDKAIGVFPSQSAPDVGYPVARRTPELLSGLVLVDPIQVPRFKYAPSDVPTLIVWGENDKVIPVDKAYSAAESFTNVTVAVLNDSGHHPKLQGHVPYLDNPADFNRLLEWFGRDPETASQRIRELGVSGIRLSSSAVPDSATA